MGEGSFLCDKVIKGKILYPVKGKILLITVISLNLQEFSERLDPLVVVINRPWNEHSYGSQSSP